MSPVSLKFQFHKIFKSQKLIHFLRFRPNSLHGSFLSVGGLENLIDNTRVLRYFELLFTYLNVFELERIQNICNEQ